MATPLLKTKLYVPPIRPELVSRRRLIERLSAGLGRKLTLISASAGFGKTTLLSEWVGACGRPVAWVSLDESDNDPIRFWAYFIAALQTIPVFKEADLGRSALAMFQAPEFPAAETSLPIEVLLTGLINEIVEIAVPFAFVLDDFHLIAERQIHETMAFLIDHLPPQMHLILSSRADPPWPLARLRARREMTEFRIDDLRFTPEEAAAFLNDAMGLALLPEDVAALEARTEGWIAGLQMAAISVRGWRRRRAHRDLSRFIESFTGSHRFVLDYLVEEVLEQQSPAMQEFLLRTSILGQVTASLCDALTERKDGQAILTQLDQANLFLVPLDDERRWYRYHRLFADLLRSRLAQGQPGQVSVLHRRASEWYKENGLIAEAVNHAFAAGDLEWAVGLIEENALSMIYRRELATLVGWLDSLPDEVVRARPWLCVAQAWALVNVGQLEAAEPLLQGAEKALVGLDEQAKGPVPSAVEGPVLSIAEGPVLSIAEGRRIASYITFVRAYLAGLSGNMALAAKLTREALERLPEEDLMARSYAVMWLAFTLRWNGELVAAAQAFAQAIAVSQAAGDIHINLHSLSGLAGLQSMLGQLRKAVAIYQDALRLADEYARQGEWRLPITSLLHSNMSAVLREWNDLEAALHHASEGFELSRHWGQPDIVLRGYVEMAAIRQAMGDADGALEAIQKARQVASSLTSWADAALAVDEARLRLAQGDVAAASQWGEDSGLGADDEIGFQYSFAYITLSRVRVAQGRLDEALGLLARLLEMTEAVGAMGQAIEILVLQALALQAQGQVDQALAALARALSLAEPGGYVRTFIDEGPPMGELLRQAVDRGVAVDYAGRLLAIWDEETKDRGPGTEERDSSFFHRPSPVLAEPLSERELEVLRLLTTSLSSREIADELVISVSTVRSHIKNIYGKLDVHRRMDAVLRAEELGLL